MEKTEGGGLYFKAGIDASDFNNKLNQMKSALHSVASATDKDAAKMAEAIAETTDEVKEQTDAIKKQGEAQKTTSAKAKESADQQIDSAGKLQGAYDDLQTKVKNYLTVAGAAYAVKQIVSNMLTIRGEIQQIETAYDTMLGSAEKAGKLMQETVQFAATTTFDMKGVADGVKQLIAYGSEADSVIEEMRMLGDIAAGLSIPLGDIVYLYGTTRTQGRLFTQDYRQFVSRGIPLGKELAKQFKVNEDAVSDLVTSGKVGFPEVEKALLSLTGAGGKFGGLMEKNSQLINGRLSNIGDSITQIFNKLGKSSEGAINTALGGVSYAVENYEKLGRILLTTAETYGAYKAALLVTSAMEKAAAANTTLLALAKGNLSKAIGKVNAALISNPYTLAAVAVAALAAGIITLTRRYRDLHEATRALKDTTKDIYTEIASEERKLFELSSSLDKAQKGTQEWNSAKDALVKQYSSLLPNLDEEITRTGSLTTSYEQLKDAIAASVVEKQRSLFLSEQEANYSEKLADAITVASDKIYKATQKKSSVLYQDTEAAAKLFANIQKDLTEVGDIRQGTRNQMLDQLSNIDYSAILNKVSLLRVSMINLRNATSQFDTTFGAAINGNSSDFVGPIVNAGKSVKALAVEAKKTLDEAIKKREALDEKQFKSVEEYTSEVKKLDDEIGTAQAAFDTLVKKNVEAASGMATEVDKISQEINASALAATEDYIAKEEALLDKELDNVMAAGEEKFRAEMENDLAIAALSKKTQEMKLQALKEGIDKEIAMLEAERQEKLNSATALMSNASSDGGELSADDKKAIENYINAVNEYYNSAVDEVKKGATRGFDAIFGDIANLSTRTLQELVNKSNEALASGELTIEQQERLAKAVADANVLIRRRNPWQEMIKSYKAWKKSSTGMSSDEFQAFQQGASAVKGDVDALFGVAQQVGEVFGEDWSNALSKAKSAVDGMFQAFTGTTKIERISGLISLIATAASTAIGVIDKVVNKAALMVGSRIASTKSAVASLANQKGLGDSLFTTDKINEASSAWNAYKSAVAAAGQVSSQFFYESQKKAESVAEYVDVLSLGIGGMFDKAITKLSKSKGKAAAEYLKTFKSFNLDTIEGIEEALAKLEIAAASTTGKMGTAYLDQAKNALEQAKEQLQEYENAITDMVGNVGDSLLDAIMKARKEGISSVESIADTIETSLEDLVEKQIWAKTMAPVFDAFGEEISDAMKAGDEAGIISSYENLFNGIIQQQGKFYEQLDNAKKVGEGFGFTLFSNDGSKDTEFDNKIAAQKKYIEGLKATASEVDTLQNNVSKLENDLTNWVGPDVSDAEAELEALMGKEDEYIRNNQKVPEEIGVRMNELNEIIGAAKQGYYDLEKQLADARKNLADAEAAGGKIYNAQKRLEDLEAEKEAYKGTMAYIEEQIGLADEALKKFTYEQVMAGEAADVLAEKKKWEEMRDAMNAALSGDGVKKVEGSIAWLNDEISKLNEELENMSAEDLTSEVGANTLAKLNGYKDQLSTLQNVFNSQGFMVGSINWLQEQISNAEDQLNNLAPEAYNGEEGARIKASIAEWEAKLEEMKGKYNTEEEAIQGSVDWLNAEIARVQSAYNALSKEDREGEVGKALKEQEAAYQQDLDNAQDYWNAKEAIEAQALADALEEYKTAETKKKETIEKYQEDIARLRAAGYEDEAKEAEKQQAEYISGIEQERLEGTKEYAAITGDIEKLGVKAAQKALDDYRIMVQNSTELSEEAKQEILAGLDEMQEKIDDVELKNLEKQFEDIQSVISSISSILSDLGASPELQDGLNGISNIIGGVGAFMAAGGPIAKLAAVATVISGIVEVVKSLKNVFSESNVEATDTINKMAEAYDRLASLINNSFGSQKNAYQAKAKEEIEAQISAYRKLIEQEKSKKKKWWDLFGWFSANPDKTAIAQYEDAIKQLETSLSDVDNAMRTDFWLTNTESFSSGLADIVHRYRNDIKTMISETEKYVDDMIQKMIVEFLQLEYLRPRINALMEGLFSDSDNGAKLDIEALKRFKKDVTALSSEFVEILNPLLDAVGSTSEEVSDAYNSVKSVSADQANYILGQITGIRLVQTAMKNDNAAGWLNVSQIVALNAEMNIMVKDIRNDVRANLPAILSTLRGMQSVSDNGLRGTGLNV